MRALSLRCTWLLDFFSASLACSSASLAAAAAPAAVFFFRPICRRKPHRLYLPVLALQSKANQGHEVTKVLLLHLRCNPAKVEAHLKTVVLCVVLPEGCCVNLHNGALHERLCPDLQSCGSMHQPTPPQQSIISMSSISATPEQTIASSYQLIVGGVVHDIQDTSLPGGCLHKNEWQSALLQGPD